MITIKEIAILAQVSPGTVDRVIHDRAGVSKKTADRVKALLKQHNFKLNDIASKLANRKKYNLATLLPSYDAHDSFWKSPYNGVLKGKEEVGFYGVQSHVFTYNQFDEVSYLSAFEELMNSQPDAVILVPIFKEETKSILQRLDREEIPYLFLNTDVSGYNNLSFVGQDSLRSGKLVAKLMHVSLGDKPECLIVKVRKNIGNHNAIKDRVDGFVSYFEEKNILHKRHELIFDSLKNDVLVKEKLSVFLTENPGVRGLYLPSSQISMIANVLDKVNSEKLTLIGHDTTESNLESLSADRISFLISQRSFNQGYDAIIMMSDYLIQNKRLVPKKYSPLEIITKENM